MLPILMISGAVLLGACSCALVLYAFLEARGRKAHRSTRLRRLNTGFGQDTLSGTKLARDKDFSAIHKIVRHIPYLSRVIKRKEQKRNQALYRVELPKMFEVIALGMRVGLGFDQAFALYARGFKTPLAVVCCERFEVWERGLISREDGLRSLAERIELKEFDRFVSLVLRALDYGAPFTHLLHDLAAEARKSHRAQRQEKVAKAPVKMLIPTGALILPAMMMLVIGPIILDITERMV